MQKYSILLLKGTYPVLTRVQVDRAIEWYDRIKSMQCKPNDDTFAIILNAYCKLNDMENVLKN